MSFLTIFRLNTGELPFSPGENILARAAAFFPLVGAILGFLLVAVDSLFSFFLPLSVSSVIVLMAGAFLTAGLHLDGFADTVDGLGAGLKGGQEKALAVMRDSRSGALGVLGLVFLILLKYSLLAGITGSARQLSLFLMPAAGRWLLVLAGKLYPYARSTPGLGQGFAGRITFREVAIASLSVLFLAACGVVVLGTLAVPSSLISAGAGLLIMARGGVLLASLLARFFGGMTGDTLGAVNELGEVLFLLGVASAGSF